MHARLCPNFAGSPPFAGNWDMAIEQVGEILGLSS